MPKCHQKWRLSCKTRHFVDGTFHRVNRFISDIHVASALHHYYVQKFTQYRKMTGETHKDQWTLRFTGRVICKWILPSPAEVLVNLTEPTPAVQPAIGDAIDMDASGYVSIDEVNRFTAHCPLNWSIPVFLAQLVLEISIAGRSIDERWVVRPPDGIKVHLSTQFSPCILPNLISTHVLQLS